MINAIIVDDERSARNVLEKLLNINHPDVRVVDKCSDLLSAVSAIKEHQPDVVFLDVEMPRHLGFEIVEHFDRIDFDIIFVTAYDKYAVKAFEVSALDYLLKPIELNRLDNAIRKLSDNIEKRRISEQLKLLTETLESQQVTKITVFHKGNRHMIETANIIAIEAEHAYCNIYLHGNSEVFVISKNLKQVSQLLEDNTQFFRTHRSWLINVDWMQSYSKSKGTITLAGAVEGRLSKYKSEDFEVYLAGR